MEIRKSRVSLIDPLSPDTVAGIFLVFRWILLLVAGQWMIPKIHDHSVSMIFNCILILMLFVTAGFYIRSSALFMITLPIQIVMGAGFLSYCFAKLFTFDNKPSYDIMSISHILVFLIVWIYDIYVSARCVEKFHEENVVDEDEKSRIIVRRSPNAALINVFRRRLLASPNISAMKTPQGCNNTWDSFSDLSFKESTAFEDLARRLV